jgi:uncharacterized protein YbbK (DUF523 family)
MDLVSACLVGVRCRYDGRTAVSPALRKRFKKNGLLPVCPEQLGGLPIPRSRAYIQRGSGEDVVRGRARVVTADRQDVTENFIRGARQVLRLARILKSTAVYAKQKSPSCGCGVIIRGGKIISGNGVTTALLRQAGITVIPVS